MAKQKDGTLKPASSLVESQYVAPPTSTPMEYPITRPNTLSSDPTTSILSAFDTGSGFSAVSLFAGCGGLDLGFMGGFQYMGTDYKRLPFDVIAAYDNDPKCVQTYRENIGNHIHEADLSNFQTGLMPKARVLLAGFPCQDFSSCGTLLGLDTERGRLYQIVIHYMQQYGPAVVVAENVPNLARMRSGDVLRTIKADFEAVGYHFKLWTLAAPRYGVPQNRTRLFLIGVRDDITGFPQMPLATYNKNSYRSVDWALDDLVHVEDESVPNQSQYFRASRAKRGNGQGDEANQAGQPAYTIRANPKSRVQFHYRLPRRLTVRECARLQTFPDSFVFRHSATTNIMQIGNAVPPVLGHHVAVSISDFLSK